jgi:hypothetical protein
MKKEITLWVLITTMNEWIKRVKNELLPQLKNVEEIVISHQITDKNIQPEIFEKLNTYHPNIKYSFMYNKWLSKNRNNAIAQSNADVILLCDDDLNFKMWFENIIKNEYQKNNYDIITFQAENEKWEKHFNVQEWFHTRFSVLKIWSWWITMKRKSILEKNIFFDENFWLWAKYPVSEENIFLSDCYKKWLKMYHSNKSIVIHSDESSWIDYENRRDLIVARIKVFKRLFGFLWWFAWVFYFTILHYKYYKNYFSIKEFFILSFKSLINE